MSSFRAIGRSLNELTRCSWQSATRCPCETTLGWRSNTGPCGALAQIPAACSRRRPTRATLALPTTPLPSSRTPFGLRLTSMPLWRRGHGARLAAAHTLAPARSRRRTPSSRAQSFQCTPPTCRSAPCFQQSTPGPSSASTRCSNESCQPRESASLALPRPCCMQDPRAPCSPLTRRTVTCSPSTTCPRERPNCGTVFLPLMPRAWKGWPQRHSQLGRRTARTLCATRRPCCPRRSWNSMASPTRSSCSGLATLSSPTLAASTLGSTLVSTSQKRRISQHLRGSLSEDAPDTASAAQTACGSTCASSMSSRLPLQLPARSLPLRTMGQ
mmetsp:Transcript_22813/g.73415  ORF Transcript_22813/g.73415 Transcript_22813/m.73415 type:complete len:328 (+) Transcript_22813:415-1398(+)